MESGGIISKPSPCGADSLLLKNRRHKSLKIINKSSKHFLCLLIWVCPIFDIGRLPCLKRVITGSPIHAEIPLHLERFACFPEMIWYARNLKVSSFSFLPLSLQAWICRAAEVCSALLRLCPKGDCSSECWGLDARSTLERNGAWGGCTAWSSMLWSQLLDVHGLEASLDITTLSRWLCW